MDFFCDQAYAPCVLNEGYAEGFAFALPQLDADSYHSATAQTVEEAKTLVETGFQYVCDIDGFKLFRKPK